MESSLPAQTLRCTQCGGELHPDEGQIFLTCPYCNSTIYLDKSRVVFHWYLAPTLDESQARASLARWMAGNQTVKDLDRKARIIGQQFEYFPIWYFKARQGKGDESIHIQPAAATSITEIGQVKLPAGDLRKVDADINAQSQRPSVPLETALQWASEKIGFKGETSEQALVHLPLYTFKYVYQDVPYTAVVEAGTGQVFANIYPAKAEVPYLLIGSITAAVSLCLASFPVIGALVSGGEGVGIGLLVCSGAGIVVLPALFALAAWIAAKV